MGNQNLFRSQKGLTVTSAGEQIIQFAKEVTVEQDRVRERIDELEGDIHGTPSLRWRRLLDSTGCQRC